MKRRLKLLAVFLLPILAGLIILRGNFWTVEGIRCSLNGEVCSAQVWEDLLSVSLGKDLIFFPKATLVQQLSLKYPEIDKIDVRRVWPRELVFRLTTSPTQAAVKGEQYFLINNAGLVLKISDRPGDLPVILMDAVKNIAVGESFDQKEVVATVKILGELKARKLRPTMAKIISPQKASLWLNDGTLISVSLQKEVGLQLDSLQVILLRVKMEGRALREIDLRFDKPVVIYE